MCTTDETSLLCIRQLSQKAKLNVTYEANLKGRTSEDNYA